jgi:hypothetical protein
MSEGIVRWGRCFHKASVLGSAIGGLFNQLVIIEIVSYCMRYRNN